MYELEDTQIENALITAHNRGVIVRVLLNQGYLGKQLKANEKAFQYLNANGIMVHWTPSYFALTHQKTLIIDQKQAIIMTFNFTPQYYATSRDFGIVDSDQNDIGAIEQIFDSDWKGKTIIPSRGDDLVWSPGSENELVALIKSAHSSIDIYNEEMADGPVVHALEDAARRGVSVRIDMTYSKTWLGAFDELVQAGVYIKTYKNSKHSLYIHAKMILVDGQVAFIGSENFSHTSLLDNRELGLFISKQSVLVQLESIFQKDWKGAKDFTVSQTDATRRLSARQPGVAATQAVQGIVKLSTSGICHAPGDSFYERTIHFKAYASVTACLTAGGRMPK